jgi:peptide/nickel transport system permease protein
MMAVAQVPAAPKRGSVIGAFVRQQPLGAFSLLFIVALVLASVFADSIAPYDPETPNWDALEAAPSAAHWFGTDNYGRDVFSRVLYGARTALSIGILSSLFGCLAGGVIGLISAYFGGRLDFAVQRFIDIMLSFPIIVIAVVCVAMLGGNKTNFEVGLGGYKLFTLNFNLNLIIAIAIPIVPKVARVVRSSVLTVREMPYIDAARAAGYRPARIIFRHIAPNVFAPFIILFAAFVAQAILLESSLSFLGLGVTEPTPAWGLMLSGISAEFYQSAPWMIIFPGLAISVTVFAFNLFGDALRDYLDPKFKL